MADLDLDELRSELDEFAQKQPKRAAYTPREERIIAGFEDIARFFEEHGRVPRHGEDRDIFERLYAVRLDRLRTLDECRTLLEPFDNHALLKTSDEGKCSESDDLDTDELLAELQGIESKGDITVLRNVQSAEERRAAEEIANRERCPDFNKFSPIFEQVKGELESGIRATRPFELKAEIRPGALFIVGGQIAYVAEMGEVFTNAQSRTDARLRVIFDNGTQSNMLMRSLQRSLHKDEAGRRITDPEAGPLFKAEADGDDLESGTIYVLRSGSDHPVVSEHREVLHKIGVTGGSVEARIAGAERQATYLLAPVEVVATYKLFNIARTRLESLIHKVFASAQLELTITDRFGSPVKPREWFLVPLHVINEAVDRIRDGSITGYVYDPLQAALIKSVPS